MKTNIIKATCASLVFFICNFSNATLISVIDGHHNIVTPSGFNGLSALGHTSTLFSDSTLGWTAAFSDSANVIIAEQYAGGFVDIGALASFVSAGGRFIQLGGSIPSVNALDKYFGTSFGYGSSLIGNHSLTASAVGTIFEGYSGSINSESSTHGYDTTSLLSAWGGDSIMANGGQTSVWHADVGSGSLTYLAWDYCCQSGDDTRAQWSEVLELAISGTKSTSVPEPSTLAIFALGMIGLASRRFKKQF